MHRDYGLNYERNNMTVKVLAVTNQKGGVGKTTTAVSIASVFAMEGKSVLLIDMDPQANATAACGYDRREVECSAMDVMLGSVAPEDACLYSEDSNLWVLPANDDLTASEAALAGREARHALLKQFTKGWLDKFDWVFIDCPPTLNILTVNALVAADYVLVPIQCEYFALEGVSALLDTIGQVRSTVNADLRVAGFIRTMYDPRSNLTRQVSENLVENLKGLVFNAVIPRNIRLAEAPSFGQPIMQYDERSRGAQAYIAAANELAQRLGE